jgi:hypothetical protein
MKMNNETTRVTAQHRSKSDAALRRDHYEKAPSARLCTGTTII